MHLELGGLPKKTGAHPTRNGRAEGRSHDIV